MEKPKLVRMLDNDDNRPFAERHGYLWWRLDPSPGNWPFTRTGRFRSVATGFEIGLFLSRFEEVEDDDT